MTLTTENFGSKLSQTGYVEIEIIGRQVGTDENPIYASVTVSPLGEDPRAPKPGEVVRVAVEDANYLCSHGTAKFYKPTTKARRGD